MKHYILIEVREASDRPSRTVHAGDIRKEIVRFCTERGINAAHCIVREDRPFIYGTGERTPYAEAAALFREAMGPIWRQNRAKNPDTYWDAREENK